MKRVLAALCFLVLFCVASWADSPLTSTSFADSYSDSPYVFIAKGAGQDLPEVLLEFLSDPQSPVDERLAVINQLGWDPEGMTTSVQMFEYLLKRYQVEAEDLWALLDAGTMAVLAYAEAMSNYFDVSTASTLAQLAVEMNEDKSFSIAMVAALIDAQVYLDSDWGLVYKVVADVVADRTLVRDMRQSAVDSIMSYIDLYEEDWLKSQGLSAQDSLMVHPSVIEEMIETVGEAQSELPLDLGDGLIVTGLCFYENHIWCQFLVENSALLALQQQKGEELEATIDSLLEAIVGAEADDDFLNELVAREIGINLVFWSAPTVNKYTFTLTPSMIQDYLRK